MDRLIILTTAQFAISGWTLYTAGLGIAYIATKHLTDSVQLAFCAVCTIAVGIWILIEARRAWRRR